MWDHKIENRRINLNYLTLAIIAIIQIGFLSLCFSQSGNHHIDIRCTQDDGQQIIKINNEKDDKQVKSDISGAGDHQPQFPGGKDSLTAFIKRNVNWQSLEFCGRGTVYVELLIDSSGLIKDSKIIHGICENYNNEVLRIISLMPQWIPPIKKDKTTMDSKIIVPIKFYLD